MASKPTSDNTNPLCPMCLESPPELMVGTTCKHIFCKICLVSYLEGLSVVDEKFPCPTCRMECRLPSSGVDGLPHQTGDNESAESKIPADGAKLSSDANEEPFPCHICNFTKDEFVEADNVCTDCQNIHFCKACTIAHRKNKATMNHIIISLQWSQISKEAKCVRHKQPITSYCCKCEAPVCSICVHIDHSDHTLEKFTEVFRAKELKVKEGQENQEKRSRYLKTCEKELKTMKSVTQDSLDTLLAAVEDQAEVCVKHITKQKEATKKQIKAHFKPKFEVLDCVEIIPALTVRLDNSVAEAKRALSTAEPYPADLSRLSALEKEMNETGKLVERVNREGCRESYQKFLKSLPKFSPNTEKYSIGNLTVETKPFKIKNAKLICDKDPYGDEPGQYIPCVTTLGKGLYAVALPSAEGKPSDAIDIYKYPEVFQRTIKEDISVYDTASTPDGNLAVLSDGNTGRSCAIRLYDPMTGNLKAVRELALQGQLSFDVNIYNQYVVLSKDVAARRVTIFNEDGSVELTHVLDVTEYDIKGTAHRIACGGTSFICIAGPKGFAFYEMDGMSLMKTSLGGMGGEQLLYDISVTRFNDICFCYKLDNSDFRLVTYTFCNKDLFNRETAKYRFNKRGGSPMRLSVTDDYLALSEGGKIKVFAL